MLRKLPGTDIPAATEANILHAAAFLEFKQHVERLAREGHDLAAYTCWMHGVEIRRLRHTHKPVNPELFRPLVRMPCCTGDCQRCAGHLGGFKFLWLGLWRSRGVCWPQGLKQLKATPRVLPYCAPKRRRSTRRSPRPSTWTRTAGIRTDALKSEWKQTCLRIAEKKVQDAEKATIDRVVNTGWSCVPSWSRG